jgi:hypothetical protein
MNNEQLQSDNHELSNVNFTNPEEAANPYYEGRNDS